MNYKMVLLVHPVFLFRLSVQQHHLAPTSKKTVLEQQLSAAHLQKNKANTQYNADNFILESTLLNFQLKAGDVSAKYFYNDLSREVFI